MTTYCGHGRPTDATPPGDYLDLDTGDVWQMRPTRVSDYLPSVTLLAVIAVLLAVIAWRL